MNIKNYMLTHYETIDKFIKDGLTIKEQYEEIKKYFSEKNEPFFSFITYHNSYLILFRTQYIEAATKKLIKPLIPNIKIEVAKKYSVEGIYQRFIQTGWLHLKGFNTQVSFEDFVSFLKEENIIYDEKNVKSVPSQKKASVKKEDIEKVDDTSSASIVVDNKIKAEVAVESGVIISSESLKEDNSDEPLIKKSNRYKDFIDYTEHDDILNQNLQNILAEPFYDNRKLSGIDLAHYYAKKDTNRFIVNEKRYFHFTPILNADLAFDTLLKTGDLKDYDLVSFHRKAARTIDFFRLYNNELIKLPGIDIISKPQSIISLNRGEANVRELLEKNEITLKPFYI